MSEPQPRKIIFGVVYGFGPRSLPLAGLYLPSCTFVRKREVSCALSDKTLKE